MTKQSGDDPSQEKPGSWGGYPVKTVAFIVFVFCLAKKEQQKQTQKKQTHQISTFYVLVLLWLVCLFSFALGSGNATLWILFVFSLCTAALAWIIKKDLEYQKAKALYQQKGSKKAVPILSVPNIPYSQPSPLPDKDDRNEVLYDDLDEMEGQDALCAPFLAPTIEYPPLPAVAEYHHNGYPKNIYQDRVAVRQVVVRNPLNMTAGVSDEYSTPQVHNRDYLMEHVLKQKRTVKKPPKIDFY